MDLQARREAFVNHKTLRRAMQDAKIDGLVAHSAKNSFYLSGCYLESQVFSRDRLGMVVVPTHGEETFIVGSLEEPMVRYAGTWISDVRKYVEHAQSPIEALVEVLREKGIDRGQVGVEEKWLTVHHYHELKKLLPDVRIVPIDPMLARVRALKTPAEIEVLGKAAVITEEAVHAAWKRSHPGDTEKAVADRMAEELVKLGAAPHHLMFGAGANTAVIHHTPGPKKLELGDLTACDFGAVYQGFWSDLGRMGVVGKPSQRQRDLYRILRDVHYETISHLRPGITGGEVFNFAKKRYLEEGVDFGWRPHIGHSMSQTRGQDEPMIQPSDRNPLEPGMLIALEPSFRTDRNRYQIEDLMLITEGAPRILSNWWNTEEIFIFE